MTIFQYYARLMQCKTDKERKELDRQFGLFRADEGLTQEDYGEWEVSFLSPDLFTVSPKESDQ